MDQGPVIFVGTKKEGEYWQFQERRRGISPEKDPRKVLTTIFRWKNWVKYLGNNKKRERLTYR
jgi:hypothetical protein